MAHRIQVLSICRPRVKQGRTVQKPELMRSMSHGTGIVEGVLNFIITELRDQLIMFLRSGRGVKIEGLGTWTPNIGMDGTFHIQYRPDAALVKALNERGAFTGRIHNSQNIGKSGDEIVQRWNTDHPSDMVQFTTH